MREELNNNLCTGKLGIMIAKHEEDPSRRIYKECPGRGQSSEVYLRKAVVFYFVLFDGEKKKNRLQRVSSTFLFTS